MLPALVSQAGPAVIQLLVTTAEDNILSPYRDPSFRQYRASAFFCDLSPLGLPATHHILTNAHVLEDATQLYMIKDKEEHPVQLKYLCRQRDLAILYCPTFSPVTTLTLEPFTPEGLPLGTSVITLGYPLGEPTLKVTSGIFSGYTSTPKEGPEFPGVEDLTVKTRSLYQLTSPIHFGSSGGALLNLQGQVIGITSSGNPTEQIDYAVPILSIWTLNFNTTVIAVPNWGITWGRTTPELVKYLSSNLAKSGVLIRAVHPDSTLLILQPGDILISLTFNTNKIEWDGTGLAQLNNYERLMTWPELAEVIPIGAELTLVVIRKRQRINLKTVYKPIVTSRVGWTYPLISNTEYLIFSGGCWVQLTCNVLDQLHKLDDVSEELNSLDLYRPWIVLTTIFPGTDLEREGNFKIGTVLTQLNGQSVATLDQIKSKIDGNIMLLQSLSGLIHLSHS